MCTASVISQHMTKWSAEHYQAACKMAAYVAHHEHGLTFTASKEGLELVSCADSDWGSHDVSRGGQVHMWMGAAVAFSSKKTLTFPSTAAAETQNAANTSTYAMGLRALLEDTPSVFRPTKPSKLVGDNSASVQICNGNQSLKPLSRFIARRINVLRQNIAQFAQDYVWAPTRRQLADPLSKLVAKPLFARFAPRLKGLKPHTEWSSDEDD